MCSELNIAASQVCFLPRKVIITVRHMPSNKCNHDRHSICRLHCQGGPTATFTLTWSATDLLIRKHPPTCTHCENTHWCLEHTHRLLSHMPYITNENPGRPTLCWQELVYSIQCHLQHVLALRYGIIPYGIIPQAADVPV